MLTNKVLGQAAPVANVLTDLYTVPASTQAVVSTLVICNRSPGNTFAYRVSVAIGGAVDAVAQYLFFDVSILKNATQTHTLGITLGPGDKIRVQSTNAFLSFNLFGVEIS